VGQVTVRVKDFHGLAPEGCEPIAQSAYFDEAKGMTFSIEASGLYKVHESISADDLLFGIVFRQFIEDRLPSGYPLGVKALQWFNPNMEFQLAGDSPSVLAPMLAIMSRITATSALSVPEFQGPQDFSTTPELLVERFTQSQEEDVAHIMNSQKKDSRAAGALPGDRDLVRQMLSTNEEYSSREASRGWFGSVLTPSQARHKWFTDKEVRRETIINSDCVLTSDLHNGFIDFKDLSLRIPGFPITVPLGQYMQGRPVQYCCLSRDRKKLFWCVVFTIVETLDVQGSTS